MKSIAIIVIATAIACSSADAAVKCDRFKVWRYHFRQACNQRAIYLARHAPHQFHTPFKIQFKAPDPFDKLRMALKAGQHPVEPFVTRAQLLELRN